MQEGFRYIITPFIITLIVMIFILPHLVLSINPLHEFTMIEYWSLFLTIQLTTTITVFMGDVGFIQTNSP